MKTTTLGRPHTASVIALPLGDVSPAASPLGSLSSRSTQSQLQAFSASEKTRRVRFFRCCGAAVCALLLLALAVALLFPRPPTVTVPAASAAASVAVARDGSFTLTARAGVVVDATSSFAAWGVSNVVITLRGAKSAAPVVVIPYGGALSAAARRSTTFQVRASAASTAIPNLVPALALISAVANGEAVGVLAVVEFTPVYLGVALGRRSVTSTLPFTAALAP